MAITPFVSSDPFTLETFNGKVTEANDIFNGLLTNETKTLYGLGSDAVPNDVLKAIGARYGTSTSGASNANKVAYVTGFVLSKGAVIGIYFSYQNTAQSPCLNVNGNTGLKEIKVNGLNISVPSMLPQMAYFQYDGTYWNLLNPVTTFISVGSYTGTGTYGSANKNSLTLNFAPKVVVIQETSSAPATGGEISVVINCLSNYAIVIYSEAKNTTTPTSLYTHKLAVSTSSNTVSYYSGYGAIWQLNNASTSYSYVAIG